MPPGSPAQQNARYAYLLGRLRNRQITMEEATELFGLMQGMLRSSEQARLAAQRAVMATAAPTVPEPGAVRPLAPVPSQSSDDLFLVGLLAMGAGAGLLAAMTKRIQDLTPPTPAETRPRPASGSSSK